MNRILVIEDDEAIREGIKSFLVSSSYLVDITPDGAAGLEAVKKRTPDLVILDLTLPKISGESVCREIKKDHPNLPVIILTAKNKSSDVLAGFGVGADDYVSKPFELDELSARIRARLKGNSTNEKITVGDLSLDPQSMNVNRGEKEIVLTPHEFKLLHYLMLNKGKVLTREMILNRVWDYSYDVDTRVVDVYVGYLRKKVDYDNEKKLISSMRGFGYVIKD